MIDLTHHPDCPYWQENYARDCRCGLTGKVIGNLKPWTREEMENWRARVNAEFKAIQAAIDEQKGKP